MGLLALGFSGSWFYCGGGCTLITGPGTQARRGKEWPFPDTGGPRAVGVVCSPSPGRELRRTHRTCVCLERRAEKGLHAPGSQRGLSAPAEAPGKPSEGRMSPGEFSGLGRSSAFKKLFVIDVKFTEHKINHFKVNNPAAFSIFTMLCSHHCLVPEHSNILWETLPPLECSALFPPSSPWPPLICCLSIFMDSPTWDTSWDWNPVLCGPLCLASLTEHVFKALPRCGGRQCFAPLYG